jgi:hypothetical protein
LKNPNRFPRRPDLPPAGREVGTLRQTRLRAVSMPTYSRPSLTSQATAFSIELVVLWRVPVA